SAPSSTAWSTITGTPTTLAGYGITDPVILSTGSYSNPVWITSFAYSKLIGSPSLAAVATSGSYNDLTNKPTIGTGSVTSVALVAPSIFSVSGSPVTASGTLSFSFNAQSANTVFAGPSSGSAATPSFRPLTSADMPVPSPTINNGISRSIVTTTASTG